MFQIFYVCISLLSPSWNRSVVASGESLACSIAGGMLCIGRSDGIELYSIDDQSYMGRIPTNAPVIDISEDANGHLEWLTNDGLENRSGKVRSVRSCTRFWETKFGALIYDAAKSSSWSPSTVKPGHPGKRRASTRVGNIAPESTRWLSNQGAGRIGIHSVDPENRIHQSALKGCRARSYWGGCGNWGP